MRKRLWISAVTLLLTGVCYAQWTAQDSIRLKKLLEGSEELKLNPEAVKQIDFGSGVGAPRMSEEKKWLLPDESLPEALPKPKVVLTLFPYKATTRYNWDPVYQRKIKVDKDTWRSDPFYKMRRGLEKIEAGKVRVRLLGERANGMMVNVVERNAPIPLFGGSGVYVNGGTIGGLDFMTVFTKDFWDKKGRECRERTLEVLRTYGDSTTILINKPIAPIEQTVR